MAGSWLLANFVRDFPVRLGRLGHTCRLGIRGVAEGRALQGNGRRFLFGLHLLLVQSFDLLGGPEIAQFFFRLIGHTTPLTTEEIAMITAVLGENGMRYQDVRIAEGGGLNLIFRWNGNLAFTAWYTICLPQAPANHSRTNRGLLVHELAHVYQHEKVGTRYMTEAIYLLIRTRRDCYGYGGTAGLTQAHQQQKQFAAFNREQQAQIVQDYYTKKEAGADTTPYEPFIQQLRQGVL